MAHPYCSTVPDFGFQLASITWRRWGGMAQPGKWSVMLPSLAETVSFHPCVVDDFGTLVEVPA